MLPSELCSTAIDALLSGGGFSLDGRGQSPQSGYVVSEAGSEVIVPLEGVVSSLCVYFRKHWDRLDEQGTYLGGWIDSGKLYLDISHVWGDRAEAFREARANNQLAIYHLDEGVTIPTPPSGGSG